MRQILQIIKDKNLLLCAVGLEVTEENTQFFDLTP
jgi:hypothetical protein